MNGIFLIIKHRGPQASAAFLKDISPGKGYKVLCARFAFFFDFPCILWLYKIYKALYNRLYKVYKAYSIEYICFFKDQDLKSLKMRLRAERAKTRGFRLPQFLIR